MIAVERTEAELPWLRAVEPACAAFAALLYPHAEVVVHELGADRIVALWNPFSGRSVGDRSLLEELPAHWGAQPMQGPYPKVELDGRPMSAVSAVVPDADGVARGLLCVNLDRSPFDDVARIFGALFAPTTAPPPELFERDWRDQIASTVAAYCAERALPRERLNRAHRIELLRRLEQAGLFATRGAADHTATALGVSRATVYSMLKEIRE
ncbi:helix-turn-helix domain-containing protein [Solirubrobacter ginsenosidimutans]|uniref:Helix-turn-helix domain-containing protein n=1 Tax=Solirubrobacter ginsenosidimutans TaxID=490573 RepID=A0A9X3S425_9ACTN|nr:helix-turn-helix domain-containing protein [Solirubrobacter ginsenosidimutans]MDA0165224.1 helix-turn-helix domain-containing protein [Solirubrobacter ginsenosidimutans]